MSTSYNPFSLHNTSSKPDSAVLGITLGTRNGTVHNLNAYATLVFEKEAYEIPDAEYFDLRPLTVENLMNYHSVDITSNQSLHFQIIPTNYCVNFSVYLKKDVKPTEADHDLNWTLPLPCSNNASFNVCNFYSTRAHDLRGLANLTDCEKLAILDKDVRNLTWGCKDPYTIFLSNMDLRMGKYWIGT